MTQRSTLAAISRPGRYLGKEFNSIEKNWDKTTLSLGLIFPDLYEIGMSHQGLQILYHILNKHPEFVAERCYCPDVDVEKLLRDNQEPLVSLETGKPLDNFDVLGFTLPYELCYTNILTILELSAIPFYAKDRDESHPLLIAGGACSMNPEPVADFFDFILLGDGEEAIVEIANLLAGLKKENASRDKTLLALGEIDGGYIPSHFKIEYTAESKKAELLSIKRIAGKQKELKRRIVANLDDLDHLLNPLVPNAKTVHDRLGVEVARGCTRGCRFCQAGITYRPVRERTPEQVQRLAEQGLENSGFEELALLSLSTGDYSCLDSMLPELMDKFADQYVSVAMPSMRVGTLTPAVMEQVKRVRKTGFTLAPEAGSERMRQVINKGITEKALLETCETAFELGWRVIKCYFMIGLPTETDEDLDEIVALVRKILATRTQHKQGGQGRKNFQKAQVNVSVGTFVPKPHTPFQWEKQLSIEESSRSIKRLQNNVPRKNCNLKYHNPRISYLEGVFSRGDRRLSKLMVSAWKKGARLDGWAEHFNLSIWEEAATDCGLDMDHYLRERRLDEILPWSHLDSGIDTAFLKAELERSRVGTYTPDCRYNACQKCGLCDFDTIKPIVHNKNKYKEAAATTPDTDTRPSPVTTSTAETNAQHFKYIVHYQKTGNICFLGHLELLQVVFRALRRAGIETHFSQGFNPSPKVSFGPALPVGTESLAEYFTMDLKAPLSSTEKTLEVMNRTLPPGMKISRIEIHSQRLPQKIKQDYTITLPKKSAPSAAEITERILTFMNAAQFMVKKTRKGKTKEINIRPLVENLVFEAPQTIKIEMISESTMPGVKPVEAIEQILGLSRETMEKLFIQKTAWTSLDQGKEAN